MRFFLRRCSVAGGSPAATHFSCFAKKSKQKKATAEPLALRASQCCSAKNGKRTKLACGSDNVHFFIHFRHRITGSVRADNGHASSPSASGVKVCALYFKENL